MAPRHRQALRPLTVENPMTHLILVTGQIAASELACLPQPPCSVLGISPAAERPLDLFSLLLSEVKLFDEATGDELAPVTAVVLPEGPHTALLFDEESAMIRAKLLLHGLAETQWSGDTGLTHAVRFTASFTDKQLDEVAQLGTLLSHLMALESAGSVPGGTPVDSVPPASEETALRVQVSRRLIEIQAEFGICPCTG